MKKTLILSAFSLALALNLSASYAGESAPNALENKINYTQEQPNAFTKKRYTIKGGWTLAVEDGQTVIVFDENFKTKGGPDLKVFLSRDELGDLSGKTALSNAQRLGVLKTNKGAQSYILPQGIDIAEFKSVIIHCEAFSVLWGGFDLPVAEMTAQD